MVMFRSISYFMFNAGYAKPYTEKNPKFRPHWKACIGSKYEDKCTFLQQ